MQFISGDEIGEKIKKEVLNLANNPHIVWSELPNSLPGVKTCRTLDISTDTEIYKAQGIINAPAAIVFDLVTNMDTQIEYDDYCQEAKLVEEYDLQSSVIFLSYAFSIPLPPRETLLYRRTYSSPDGKKFLSALRSVEHERVPRREGYCRVEVFPSGFLAESLPNDNEKCLITHIWHPERMFNTPADAISHNYFHLGAMIGAKIVMIRDYLERTQMDYQKQYLLRIATRTFKEIWELFIPCNQKGEDGWRKVKEAQMDSNEEIWVKRLPSCGILCTSGIFKIAVPPRTVVDVLVDLSPELDHSTVTAQLIESIDEFTKMWYLCWESPTQKSLVDAVIIRSNKKTCEGTHMIVSRSVVHSAIPVYPDKIRVEILPSGYFIHPLKEGTESLITYSYQVDLAPYKMTETFEGLEKLFVSRATGMINSLRNKITHHQKTPSGTLDYILNSRKRPELDSFEVETTKRTKMEIEYSVVSVDVNESPDPLPPISEVLSRKSLALFYRRRPFTFLVSRKTNSESLQISDSFSFLELLPEEILVNIFSFLGPESLGTLSRVNRRFKVLTEDDQVWQHLFRSHWDKSPTLSKPEYDWKSTFKAQSILIDNWKNGRYSHKVILEHSRQVQCVQLGHDLVISGGSDKLVKVWDLQGQCLKTFGGSHSAVSTLSISQDGRSRITCAYRNGEMKSWDLNSGDIVWDKQFNYFSEGFQFTAEAVISWDQTVQMWDIQTGELLGTYSGHSRKVTCVETHLDRMVSGSTDKSVNLWSLESAKRLRVFNGHSGAVNSLDLDETLMVSGANDKLVKLWDSRVGSSVTTFRGHVSSVRCVRMNTYLILSGSNDHSIRVWDKRMERQHVHVLHGHQSPVFSLALNEERLISGAKDGKVILWNFAQANVPFVTSRFLQHDSNHEEQPNCFR